MPHLKWSAQARQRLRTERIRQNLTLEILSGKVDCSEPMLSMIETGAGDKTPGDVLADRLCEVLGLKVVVPEMRLMRR